MAGFVDEVKNLNRYNEEIQALVVQIFKQIEPILEARILDGSTLAKAKADLLKAYNNALLDVDFVNLMKAATVKAVVESSYVKSVFLMPKPEYSDKLLRTIILEDSKNTLSKQIRIATRSAITEQKAVIFEGLKTGKTVVKLSREIVTQGNFEKALPKYIEDLRSLSVNGKKLSPKKIAAAKRQISRIKTHGLKQNYNRLINRLELGKELGNSVENAMVSKTKYHSYRMAQNQTHATVSQMKNDTVMKDDNTKYVKTKTQGEVTCAYCLGIADLGYVPVENATLPPHHPFCDCIQKYKKTVAPVEPWTEEEYTQKATAAVNKRNKVNQKNGDRKSYIPIQKPYNLRTALLADKLNGA